MRKLPVVPFCRRLGTVANFTKSETVGSVEHRGWARIQGCSKSVERFGSQGLKTSRTFYAASIDCSEVEHFALARRPVLILAQPRRANQLCDRRARDSRTRSSIWPGRYPEHRILLRQRGCHPAVRALHIAPRPTFSGPEYHRKARRFPRN
jgi:hypothetical protein